jgi:hypothetical protein
VSNELQSFALTSTNLMLGGKSLDAALLSAYFEFVFKTRSVQHVNEDLDSVKEVTALFRERLNSLGLQEELKLLDKVSHYEKM